MTREAPDSRASTADFRRPCRSSAHRSVRAAARRAPTTRDRALLVLTRNSAVDDRHELEQLAMPHVDKPVDRCCGNARRIAAAAGIAWMMSPSEPSRTMRNLLNLCDFLLTGDGGSAAVHRLRASSHSPNYERCARRLGHRS